MSSSIDQILNMYNFSKINEYKAEVTKALETEGLPERDYMLSTSDVSKAIGFFNTTVSQRKQETQKFRTTSPIPDFSKPKNELSLKEKSEEFNQKTAAHLSPFLD